MEKRLNYQFELKLALLEALSIGFFLLLLVLSFFLLKAFDIKLVMTENLAFSLVLLILWLVLHEILHGLGFYLWDYKKKKKIVFGMKIEKGIFYCMCKTKISKTNILIAILAPFIIIGIIPYILAFYFQSFLLLVLAIFNLTGSLGDIVMFIAILKMPKDIEYLDLDDPTSFNIISKTKLKKKYFSLKLKEETIYDPKIRALDNKFITISPISKIFLMVFFLVVLLISILL